MAKLGKVGITAGELIPTVLFKGTTNREYVVIKEDERDIFFTKKLAEATIFKQQDADLKAINFPSHQLQKILLND